MQWTDLIRCAVCWDAGADQPFLRRGDHLYCPQCHRAGRRRVSAAEQQVREAWSRHLRGLHLDRLALVEGQRVLRERHPDQPDRYVELGEALAELQSLPPSDHVLLMRSLAHHALWDGYGLRVMWRQPFDFLVGAGVAVGASEPDGASIDKLVGQIADQAGEIIAGALASIGPPSADGRQSRQDRLRQLGPCNVLTVNDAIAELGMGKVEGREWLEAKGLIHHPGRPRRGSGRVIVSELIEALKSTRGNPTSRRMAPTKLPLPKTDRF